MRFNLTATQDREIACMPASVQPPQLVEDCSDDNQSEFDSL
jgi:hypothetical protein